MPVIELIRGRTIVHETPNFYIFDADFHSSPGFYTIEPKHHHSRTNWALEVLKHLEAFMQTFQVDAQRKALIPPVVALQADHTYAVKYRDGDLRINPGLGRVEISMHHPALDEVLDEICKIGVRGTVFVA